jgi:hypothetical protein
MKAVLGLAVLAALTGCTVIDRHERVPGWPELKVIERHVSHQEMRDRCSKYAPPLSAPEGCTLFYLDQGEAHIYVSKEFPLPSVLEHERLHAAGYDHIGSSGMRRMLVAWKASRSPKI